MIFEFNKYDNFAEDFSQKRKKPWKYFVEYLNAYFNQDSVSNRKDFGICCDLGCGSGRHTLPLAARSEVYIGLDLSFKLLKLAKSELESESETMYSFKTDWIACDIEHLPIRENSFSIIVSIAVLHHIIGKKKRQFIVNNLYQLLKERGMVILSVWGYTKEQRKRGINTISNEKIKGIRIGRFWLLKIYDFGKKSKFRIKLFEKNTFVVPWKVDNSRGLTNSTPRIYHFFKKDELLNLKGNFDAIHETEYGDSTTGPNYFITFKKK